MNKLVAFNISDKFFRGVGPRAVVRGPGVSYGIGEIVGIIVQSALVISGVIVFFLFIFGGLSIIMGAGNQDPQQAAKGKAAITYAVIGFFLVFTAFWIIRIIEIIIGVDFITAPGI